jgi:E3 ubiquitin-protein ligase SIAH1
MKNSPFLPMASGDFSRPKQARRWPKLTPASNRSNEQSSSNSSCTQCFSHQPNSSISSSPSTPAKKRPSVAPTVDPDLILKHLRCVGCSKRMAPPLPQCKRGHLICLDCGRQVSLCPLCNAALSGERNFALEMVAEVVPYPCSYQSTGEL